MDNEEESLSNEITHLSLYSSLLDKIAFDKDTLSSEALLFVNSITTDGVDVLQDITNVIVNHKPLVLTECEKKEYDQYKYSCIEESTLANIYRRYFVYVQKFVDPKIHPNILTFFGLLSILISYSLSGFSSTIMAVGVFLYLTFDGIDGIHARTTGQTSIIGEYSDHVFDLINTGLISVAFCNNIGITNTHIQTMYVTCCSFTFMLPHIKSTDNKIIVFEGLTDVSMVLSFVILSLLTNIKLYDGVANSYLMYSAFFSAYVYFLYNLYNIQFITNDANKIKKNVIFYYIIKWFTLILNPEINVWRITVCDIYLLMQLTNYKIFKMEFDVMALFVPIVYSMSPDLTIIGILYYFIKSMQQISNELNIYVFYTPETVLLKPEEKLSSDEQLSTKKNI